MRRISVFLVLSLLVASAAYPCSNKMMGRHRVQRARPALRPASILILSNQSLRVYAKSFNSCLKQLGHKVEVIEVANPEDIVNAVSSGNYDIVMTSVGDMGSLVEQLEAISADVVPHSLTLPS